MSLPYNPAHAVGTCSACGKEMIFNVPRLGKHGGFIHKESGYYMCGGQPAFHDVMRSLGTLTSDARGALREAGWSDEDILRVIPIDHAPLTSAPLTAGMDNVTAWKLGEIARDAGNPAREGVGDPIDRGLILRRLLGEKGFLVIRGTPAPQMTLAETVKKARGGEAPPIMQFGFA